VGEAAECEWLVAVWEAWVAVEWVAECGWVVVEWEWAVLEAEAVAEQEAGCSSACRCNSKRSNGNRGRP